MSQWPAAKARRVLAALLRIGWQIKRESGSHRTLERTGWPDWSSPSTMPRNSDLECWPASPSTPVSRLTISELTHAVRVC